jgi:hypothetical protein
LIWGDVVHNAAVQFPQPTVTIEFDSDPKKALSTRLSLFKWTAKDALLVAGMHLPFPGLGHVRAEGKGQYGWVPIDFTPMPAPRVVIFARHEGLRASAGAVRTVKCGVFAP